ncbi:hypothetical protein [Kitasatospora sp. LaBMicrA B282]|uniref:hypothetical protein n=1 Tax=Kitasatospora sp. LaBMicrA B282 TaxID=3420949 RepID=UPI003D0E5003
MRRLSTVMLSVLTMFAVATGVATGPALAQGRTHGPAVHATADQKQTADFPACC